MADESISPTPRTGGGAESRRHSARRAWLPLRAGDIQLYRVCDALSGALILPMLIFSPWVFGTTQKWAIGAMNYAGYGLGLLFLMKVFIRELKGYPAMRWGVNPSTGRMNRRLRRLVQVLAGLTLAVLGFSLISALNASATYNPAARLFEYREYLSWLPHSFDRDRTWFVFGTHLGLAGSFWAVWDWLSGMTSREEIAARIRKDGAANSAPGQLPARLQRLLWVLCLSGGALGIEGIVQRAMGSDKLLFLVQPLVNKWSGTQFGPYSYRSNAAQYFNLLWPVCLGFWWTLQRGGGIRWGRHQILLVCAAIMAACPIISSSRGGALVAAAMALLAVGYLILASLPVFNGGGGGESRWQTGVLLSGFLVIALGLGWYFGWSALAPRLEQFGEGFEGREAMFDAARPITADYPWYGTGPGTFGVVFQLYRYSQSTYWPEQLHNDWLETRITFGWVGFSLILAALACVLLRRFVPGRIRAARRLVVLGWLALAGCLVHAVFDFPLQIHSILFLFLVICAMLFMAGGRRSRG